ncbi:2Fe-2S iron-sulfur cluster-binding protein [Beijerinckia indica]|uniref:2Fe-2S ferredoxin n=1 Tax=Beijerinckia indica subsp. indica (strain ATCC 9039 / DSM 1715 / NCIMB 8712) TaxID=395963 RepID=B2IE36_BEII9|nr:ferredoxin [Beijerinckia indica]ACB94060.1 2Fe-2S ferredoxin [Beijerinckia indica subsp. indica ATCC 9039]
MPIVTIKPQDKTQEGAEGTTLREVIIAAGIPLNECTCAKGYFDNCHAFITEGKKSLGKATREENERLDQIVGVGSKSRLICEAKLGPENVTVELLGALSG